MTGHLVLNNNDFFKLRYPLVSSRRAIITNSLTKYLVPIDQLFFKSFHSFALSNLPNLISIRASTTAMVILDPETPLLDRSGFSTLHLSKC